MMTPTQQSRAVACARSLVGAPYVHQGRTRTGIDCIGLVLVSLQAAGWQPTNPTCLEARYRITANSPMLLDFVQGECDEVPVATSGDILLFRFREQKFPNHLGLVSEVGADKLYPVQFIHTYYQSTCRRVVEHQLRDEFERAFLGIYRIKDFS